MMSKFKVLGIDPGIATTGWAILTEKSQKPFLIECGSIETLPITPGPLRLVEIFNDIQEIMVTYQPNYIFIEKLFFAKNVKTAMQVAEARGVIIAACSFIPTPSLAGVATQPPHPPAPIAELAPNQIKKEFTGVGHATKKQVQYFVKQLFHLDNYPKLDDITDAIAIAYVGLRRLQIVSRK